MCTSAKKRYHPPTPPTPDKLRSIQHVYKCKERYHPPTPPTPDKLRSIQHVYKCKERYHPPTPPTPDKLRSIQHVYKCNELYHPPTPRLPQKKLKSCGVVPGPASKNKHISLNKTFLKEPLLKVFSWKPFSLKHVKSKAKRIPLPGKAWPWIHAFEQFHLNPLKIRTI